MEAEKLKSDKKLVAELIKHFETASAPEKGSYMEAMEYVTKDDPSFAARCLDFVIEHINDEAPRVKLYSLVCWRVRMLNGLISFL